MDFLLQLLTENQLALITAGIAIIVAIANVVTMVMPSVGQNPIYNKVMGFLNVISLNIFKNKNADAE